MRRIHFSCAGNRTQADRCLQAIAIGLTGLILQGCAERKPHAYPWATAIAVRPHKPQAAPGYIPPKPDDAAPELRLDFPPPPSKLVTARVPVRPHVPAPPAPNVSTPEKPEALSLAPQMSEQEIASAQAQSNSSIAIAQKNLAATNGRKLNPIQTDLASKVRSFIDESSGAARNGDWNRAKNLAKKAQVLSEELADSL